MPHKIKTIRVKRRIPRPTVEVNFYKEDVDLHAIWANLRFTRHDGVEGEKLVPRKTLRTPADTRNELDPLGVNYDSADLTRLAAAHTIDTTKVRYGYSTTGWRPSGQFGHPNRTIHENGHDLTLMPVDDDSVLATCRESAGSLEKWNGEVCQGFTTSSYALFGFGVVCAAPLLLFSKASEGAIFAFSGESGVGKTTICAAAQAIMGNPDRHALKTWDATAAGMKDMLGGGRDIAYIIDDMSTDGLAPADRVNFWSNIGQTVAGGGRRKVARSHEAQYGAAPLRRPGLALTGGEVSPDGLAQTTKQTVRGGARVRFIDIPLPPKKAGGAFDLVLEEGLGGEIVETAHMAVTWLAQVTSENYGLAFPKLLDHLESHYGDLAGRVPKIEAGFVKWAMKGRTDDGSELRMALKFGLVFAGLKMAIEAGILGITTKQARRAVRVCLDAALRRHDEGRQERSRQVRQLKRILRDPTKAPILEKGEEPPAKASAFRRKTKGGEKAYMREDQIPAALEINEIEVRELVADLAGRGKLVPGAGGLTRPVKVGGKPVRHYVFEKAFYARRKKRSAARKPMKKVGAPVRKAAR